MTQNRRWHLAAYPEGEVKTSDFRVETEELPELEDGQFRVALDHFAFEPAMRVWITGRDTYIPGLHPGDPMRSMATGVVDQSKNPDVPEGTAVVGMFGWQEYAIASDLREYGARAIPEGVPATWTLGVLGITGLTAYFGMLDVGEVAEGMNVLVSGAAGATGSVASQIAKNVKGAKKVVGVAGGPTKCGWLTETAGLDGAIDYKALDTAGIYAAVAEQFPDGIDLFFDNTGGPILDAALANINVGGRIVLCGAISQYDTKAPPRGPANYSMMITQRARMQGFIVTDYGDRFAEASVELAGWVMGGKIAHEEDIQEGFERAPEVFQRLFTGANRGKQLLKIR
jgi:hypothetical protein